VAASSFSDLALASPENLKEEAQPIAANYNQKPRTTANSENLKEEATEIGRVTTDVADFMRGA